METVAAAIPRRLQQAADALSSKQYTSEKITAMNGLLKHAVLFAELEPEQKQGGEVFVRQHQALSQQIKLTSHTSMAMGKGNAVDEQLLMRGNLKLQDSRSRDECCRESMWHRAMMGPTADGCSWYNQWLRAAIR